MKTESMRLLKICGLLGGLVLCWAAYGGEILAENGDFRVVTGDWAVWATRGLEKEPTPIAASDAALDALVDACQVREVLALGNAFKDGLARFGWAQFEFEPEVVAEGQKLRVWHDGQEGNIIRAEVWDVDTGLRRRARRSAEEGVVVETIHTPDNLDRSVYRSLISPEYFVLSQEHFQRQFWEEMLDLSHPGLEQVKYAWESRKPALALYELAEYYRRKTVPARLIRKPAASPAAPIDPVAEDICNHVFKQGGKTVDMGPVMDWSRHPVDVAEWLWNFNNHHHFVQLLEGYLATRNERYTDAFVTQMSDWVIQNPAPPYTLTRVATWRNLEAGGRCSKTWPAAFYGFLSSPRFTPQAIQLMLGSLWSHGDYILKHPAGLRKPNNWSVIDSTGLIGVACYWPEFKEAGAWRATGFERLARQLRMQVYPDGAQYELAPSYHAMCLTDFGLAYELARENDFRLPEDFAQRLESMYDYLMWIVKPDGKSPTPSDSGALDVRAILSQGAERFGRADFRYITAAGADGSAPDGTSRVLPYAGYTVMRSGWDADALYLFFDGGPLGVSHSHEDKLNIEVSAYGRDFLIDPGPYHYTNDSWRQYFVSTAAHSTILVDGLGQERALRRLELEAPEHPEPAFLSRPDMDFVSAVYDAGYGPEGVPVTHRRSIVFVKPRSGGDSTYPGCWVIFDEVLGEGSHRVESLFHFAPGLRVETDGENGVRTAMSEGANLRILVSSSHSVENNVVEGQEHPVIQGWYARGHTKEPAPVASFAVTTTLPLTLGTLLLPTDGGVLPHAQMTVEPALHDTLAATIRVDGTPAFRVTIDAPRRSATIDLPQ